MSIRFIEECNVSIGIYVSVRDCLTVCVSDCLSVCTVCKWGVRNPKDTFLLLPKCWQCCPKMIDAKEENKQTPNKKAGDKIWTKNLRDVRLTCSRHLYCALYCTVLWKHFQHTAPVHLMLPTNDVSTLHSWVDNPVWREAMLFNISHDYLKFVQRQRP